jgi:fatty-acyl-CoA synthase
VRIRHKLDTTETFKQKTHQLMQQGFDPAFINEPLYFKDPKSGEFRSLDRARFSEIVAGEIRF